MSNEFENSGITLNHNIMPNGERRFRMYAADGSGYIRTEAAGLGSWQNSHFHTGICEVYIVQKGRIVIAELASDSGTAKFTLLREGDAFFIKFGVAHNIFTFGNSVIHTVKYGANNNEPDWNASVELDEQTRHLSEDAVLRLCEGRAI